MWLMLLYGVVLGVTEMELSSEFVPRAKTNLRVPVSRACQKRRLRNWFGVQWLSRLARKKLITNSWRASAIKLVLKN